MASPTTPPPSPLKKMKGKNGNLGLHSAFSDPVFMDLHVLILVTEEVSKYGDQLRIDW